MIYIILGPPGSGKGTQAKLLSEKLKIPVVSTGDIVRDAFKRRTPDGIEAEKYLERGEWVPDKLIFKMLKEHLEKVKHPKSFILDAFPRRVGQTKLLDGYLKERGLKIRKVFHLDTSEETVTERIKGRVKEDTKRGKLRKDESPRIVKERLEEHRETIEPILKYYEDRGLLERVDNSPPIEEVHKEIMRRLE